MKKLFKYLLVALLAITLVGCGGNDEPSNDSGEKTQKDTFIVALDAEPDFPDPAHSQDNVTSAVIDQLYYPLFSIGENGETINEACESYTVSDDGLVYTFKLLPNMKWSDGKDVTAADFEFGIKRSIGMGAADAYYSYFITDFVLNAKKHSEATSDVKDMGDVGVRALDDLTLEITLYKPCQYFTSLMTAPTFNPARSDYMKEHDYKWAIDPSVPTNGAYKLKSCELDSEIIFERNENYIHADKVTTQTLKFIIMPDMNAQLIAYQSGEIDFARSVGNEVFKLYEGNSELVVPKGVVNYYMMLNAYSGNEALKDVNVRKALSLAINREELCTALNAGDLYYPLYGYVPKGIPGKVNDFREESGKLTDYNPEEAKKLLADAGYGENNPVELVYYTNASTLHDLVAQIIQQQLAAVGVKMTIQNTEIRVFFDDRDHGLFDLARGAMSADYMDPAAYLDMAASWNQVGKSWGDDHFDELLLASQSEVDPDKRLDILYEAEKYLVDEMAYTVPLFGYGSYYLVKPNTTGITYSPQGGTSFAYVKAYK